MSMNKQLLLIVIFCGKILQLHGVSDQIILRTIVSNHTYALDCKNMYEKRLDFSRLWHWQGAILNVKQFIQSNTKKEKKFLLNCFDKIYQANQILINSIDSVYDARIQGKLDKQAVIHFRQKFNVIVHRMRYIQKSLDWVASKHDDETKAIKQVQTLAQFIGVTAKKAHLNLSIFNVE